MENNELKLNSSIRQSLSMHTRIFNSVLGIVLIIYAIINYQSHWLPLVFVGVFSIIYGVVGFELFKTSYSIFVTNNTLSIQKSFQQDIVIDLSKTNYISMNYNELQVHYADYVKTYNIPWLTGDDYQVLIERLEEISKE